MLEEVNNYGTMLLTYELKVAWQAVLCAKPIVGDDDFVVVLPDVILDAYTANQKTENLVPAGHEKLCHQHLPIKESTPL